MGQDAESVGSPTSFGLGRVRETGLETIGLSARDDIGGGSGGRQYGPSQQSGTLQNQGQNHTSTARLGAVEECRAAFARSCQFARIVPSCHRRIHRLVLLRIALNL